MNRSVSSIVRALMVVLLFVPAPLAAVAPPAAYADVVAAEPAVEAPEEAEDDEENPWTFRFLAPAMVVIGVITVGAASAYYVFRVRNRYRVVS